MFLVTFFRLCHESTIAVIFLSVDLYAVVVKVCLKVPIYVGGGEPWSEREAF